jgi:hypothetical protein
MIRRFFKVLRSVQVGIGHNCKTMCIEIEISWEM